MAWADVAAAKAIAATAINLTIGFLSWLWMRPAEADAPSNRSKHRSGYIFFSSHILVVAFHVPPAFAQSASVFAAVAPAKAGPVNASAKATANVEMRIFMGFSPLR
jgi:hypothetical protein